MLKSYEKRFIMEEVNTINKYSHNSLCCIEPLHRLRKKSGTIASYHMNKDAYKLVGKKTGKPIITEILPSVYYVEYPIYKKLFNFGGLPEFHIGIIQETLDELTIKELQRLLETSSDEAIDGFKIAYLPNGNEEIVKVLTFNKNTKVVYYVQEFEFTYEEGE